MQSQVDDPPPDPRALRSEIPGGLADLLAKMLAKSPTGRPQSYGEVLAALAPFLDQSAEGGSAGALVFTEGPLAGRKVDLPMGEFVVGRQADCNLVLDGQNASRRHALFIRDEQGLRVRDLGSRNGVLVNGARVTTSRLQVGDRVRVGAETFAIAPSDGPATGPVTAEVGSPRLALLRTLAQVVAGGQRETFATALVGLVRPPVLGVNRYAMVVWDAGKPRTVLHEGRTEADKSVSPLQSAIGLVQTQGQVLAVADARVDPRFQLTNPEVAAVLCAPLRGPRGLLGVLYADAREPRSFTADDLTCFEVIASLCALALRG
jgi:GAF domain-containing protein